MPVSLSPGSKDNHVMYVAPFLKEHGTCECSAKSRHFRSVEKSAQLARVVE